MRGEHFVGSSEVVPEGGSSPHTRGTRYCTNNECETFRFIPAYAGNEVDGGRKQRILSVHPRIRGEREQRRRRHGCVFGSSPHTRGTIDQDGRREAGCRFIPAYAGNENS